MKKNLYSVYSYPLLLLIVESVVFKFIGNWAYWQQTGLATLPTQYGTFVLICVLVWWIVSWCIQPQSGLKTAIKDTVISVGSSLFLHALLLLTLYALFQEKLVAVGFGVFVYGAAFAGIVTLRLAAASLQKNYGSLDCGRNRFIIIGSDVASQALAVSLQTKRSTGTNFLGCFSLDIQTAISDSTDELKKYCLKEEVGEIYLSTTYSKAHIEDIARFADAHCIHLRIIAESKPTVAPQLSFYNSMPVFATEDDSLWKLLWYSFKRLGFKTKLFKQAY